MKSNGLFEELNGMIRHCQDIATEQLGSDGQSITLYFQPKLVDMNRIREYFMPELVHMLSGSGKSIDDLLEENGAKPVDHPDLGIEECAYYLFSGMLLVYFEDVHRLYSINFANMPHRQPEESALEPSIRGARDGFVEELDTNIALIRKRLTTADLRVTYYESSGTTPTRLALLHFKDRVPLSSLHLIQRRLECIGDTNLVGGMSRLEEAVSGNRYSVLPLSNFTGKPDYAAECLVRGKFLVFMEGSPTAMIAPVTLSELFVSSEDSNFSYHAAIANRLLRIMAAFITVFSPGVFISLLMYNQDQIPFQLLATIGISRLGLPISAFVEMLLSLFLLDLLREAGARLPRATGSTITVVGGIIIGDAALRAGILSPSMTFLAAVAIVSGSTLVNLNLQSTTRIMRLFVLILSALCGIYGTIIALFYMLVYAINTDSFGQLYFPYERYSRKASLLKFIRLPFRKNSTDIVHNVPALKSEEGS
ncbi:Spore germination protein XA [Paenibacillus solanacearum]|uniref:Spore germination protein XA n=1 Tax=Paenibacillus solanacearum TaxID=2048548 RepID=A0A916NUY3_9BACL|nr:spore germination protein [Paenibacillus solanacearum]CAG7601213.1 Spore germination protein XA [Paenibacillus solanacearum]